MWSGKYLNHKDGIAQVIAEDDTHILLKFENGTRLVNPKNRYRFEDLHKTRFTIKDWNNMYKKSDILYIKS